MLNRRTFLKTGLTTGAAALPLAAALEALDSCRLAPGEARSIANRGNVVATMLVVVVP